MRLELAGINNENMKIAICVANVKITLETLIYFGFSRKDVIQDTFEG